MAHGKKSRERARQKKLYSKRARREAQRALWETIRGTGKNKKKKSGAVAGETAQYARITVEVITMLRGKRIRAERKVHGGPPCGNIGCKRCSPLWRV